MCFVFHVGGETVSVFPTAWACKYSRGQSGCITNGILIELQTCMAAANIVFIGPHPTGCRESTPVSALCYSSRSASYPAGPAWHGQLHNTLARQSGTRCLSSPHSKTTVAIRRKRSLSHRVERYKRETDAVGQKEVVESERDALLIAHFTCHASPIQDSSDIQGIWAAQNTLGVSNSNQNTN